MMNGAGFAMVCCNPHWGCLPFFHCYPHASWDGHIYKVIFARSCGLSVKNSKKVITLEHVGMVNWWWCIWLQSAQCLGESWKTAKLHGAEMTEKQLMTEKQSVPVFGPCQVSCSSCPSAWDHMARKRRNLWDCNNWWGGTLLVPTTGMLGWSTVGSNLTGPSFIEYEVMYVRDQILFVWSDCQRAWEDVRSSFDEIHGQLDKPLQFNSLPLKKRIIPKRTGLFSNHHFSEAIC